MEMRPPAPGSLFEKAQIHVGNVGEDFVIVGQLQLDLLRANGLAPGRHVLEIGCGCLLAGSRIMHYLKPDRYVGIEPNTWLIEAAKEGLPDVPGLIAAKRPIFLSNLDFDASETDRKFDFVIGHSILSHAAHWQLPLFLRNVKKVLAPRGIVLASIRFCDQSGKLMGDSQSPEWVYPEVSYFAWETVQAECAKCYLYPEWRKDYRQFFTMFAPSNYHDWVRITNTKDSASHSAVRNFGQAAALAVLGKRRLAQGALSRTWRRALKLLQ